MGAVFKNVLERVSIKVKNYKCFGEELQGFDRILPINIIIGRNNTGKSSLLELVQYATALSPQFVNLKHKGTGIPEVLISQPLQEPELKRVFQENVGGAGIPTSNHWQYGSKWIGKVITYKLESNNAHVFVSLDPQLDLREIFAQSGANGLLRLRKTP